MEKIKKIIIVIVIIIVAILTCIIILNNKKSKDDNIIQLKEGEDPEEVFEVTNEIEKVKTNSKYFDVENCIQTYYDTLNNKSDSYYIQRNDGTTEQIVSNEEINKLRLDLLDKNYVQKNNININNIDDYISPINEKVIAIALEMRVLDNIPTSKYVVYGYIMDLDYKLLNDFYIYVNIDAEQQTFSIEPIHEEYNNIDEIKFENGNDSIAINDNNVYMEEILDYREIAENYFMNYKRIVLSNPEIIYNHLDENYRELRYGSINEFKSNIEENRDIIKKISLSKYKKEDQDDYIEYTCIDNYGNYYIFKETGAMEYTLILDTYTVDIPEVVEKYNNSSIQEKVGININKFIRSINGADYKYAYNVLAESFKNNSYKTQQEFEQFIKTNLYKTNKVEFINYSEQGTTYIYKIIVKNAEDESQSKDMTIVMQLGEETDFVMSFSM